MHKYISYLKNKLSISMLAKVVREYLSSQTVTNTIESIFE